MLNLADIGTVKEILRQHDFSFSKSLGQNFLINPHICPRMADSCACGAADCVVEIGPGIGVLTYELAQRFSRVVSFELDKRLLPVLSQTLSEFDNVSVINEDFLTADVEAIMSEYFDGKPFSVCANLPYYITSPILMHLLESRFPIDNITVMVQKEAADRICAEPGSKMSGAISSTVHYYSEPQKLFDVSSGSFMPAPKVNSAVIQLKVRKQPPVSVDDEQFFFKVIKAAFAQRRKTASNSLASGLGLSKAVIDDALIQAGFDKNIRAETFTLKNFADISNFLSRC